MIRNVTIDEISDGKLYTKDDLVKANCHGCEGCSDCCHGMGNTVVLDPYDAYRMTILRNKNFTELLAEGVELGVVDGLILPSLKMTGEGEGCAYLNGEGRCSVHSFRPGICRLFPLGRVYEDGTFHYFLQTGECSYGTPSKIKVKQWIDTPNLKQNESFEIKWHYFQKELLNEIQKEEQNGNESYRQEICTKLLQIFYLTPYTNDDFYEQVEHRFETWSL